MGRQRVTHHLINAEETRQFGASFSQVLKPNTTIALRGDLGAGKTTFMQGLLQGLNSTDWAQSPTFTLMQTYEAQVPVHHFDLYRLSSEKEFLELGFNEFFDSGAIVAIEWPERIESLIPKNAILLDFAYADLEGRTVQITTWENR